ncbi:MAG: hypothetical protein JXO44_05610, partial [Clostridia bacterium]|nr:hypothetical protein [Clostridia bacterium]
ASEIFYAENYQIREVPQFYVDQYDIEIPYMALGYVSGDVQDGMPQGGGNLRIFDYNKDGSLKRTIKLIGEFENGVLVGPGQMFINYEVKPAEPQVAEIMGDFYYGLLHGKSTVIMRGFNSESNQRLITVYEGTYEFGDKEGQFTERTTIDDQSTTMTGVFENDVKVGEWTPVGENASASN